jgi:3-deoxy-7-phosphoheptulonate synthase
VQRAGHPVVWACDPMHGNTYVHESGYKTRHFDAVMQEVEQFFACCNAQAVWPGGVLVELTGDNVTECLGGGDEVRGEDLESRYETLCDPRLNARQGLDLAFRLADLVRR